ncbi:hypothetical protein HPO_04400 [Hyphomonas polymorpha PS728]|uniref:Uncharacterized protein n=1 Tax=Hyphomonas polymorpha PS728 TaxID=1280954 RepID=A0A062VJ27_9PROT|nr:hypothetical protein HPO_04400 [Hyphomonas polymorpha PS728]
MELNATAGAPVISPFELYELIWRMYKDQDRKALYLRNPAPNTEVYVRLRNNLRKSRYTEAGPGLWQPPPRVIAWPDLPSNGLTRLAGPAHTFRRCSAGA